MNSGHRSSFADTLAAIVIMIAITATWQTAAAQQTLELTVDGTQRAARVYPGRRADAEPSPLVIVFHGLGDTARNFANAIKFHEAWPEATVVYPKGKPRDDRDGMNGWHGFRDNDENHDLDFVDALLDELPKRYKVDPERVYVSGFSNGGHLTFNLLLDRPCSFAAFAPVGALAGYVADAETPRPVIYLFGRDEPKEYSEAWQGTVVAIAKLNRASGEKREWTPGFTEFVAGPSGQSTVYALYSAGHIWPAIGNDAIVRFFREHKLNNSCGGAS
jgi:poly(3-hydroxybutyrate) depolymerase